MSMTATERYEMRRAKEEKIDKEVGRRVRHRRNQLGLSQSELGEKIGVSFQQVQKIEKGNNRAAASRLIALGEALQCPPSHFLPENDYPIPEIPATFAERLAVIRGDLAAVQGKLHQIEREAS